MWCAMHEVFDLQLEMVAMGGCSASTVSIQVVFITVSLELKSEAETQLFLFVSHLTICYLSEPAFAAT